MQIGHAGGDQPADGGNLAFAQVAARIQRQHYRSGRRLAVTYKQGFTRHGQVNARFLDGMHGLDGVGQLALQGALIGDLLGELAGAKATLIQQLETGIATARQALRGHLHAHIMHTILRHQNGGTVAVELVGHVHLAQGRDNRTAIAVVQIGEQYLVGRAAAPQQEGDNQSNQCGTQPDQRYLGQGAQCVVARKFVQQLCCLTHG